MPRDGTGTYAQPAGDFANGTVIDAAAVEARLDDLGGEITRSLSKDGQTTASANLPMGGFKHTGAGAPTVRDQYARVAEIQDGKITWAGTTTGTASAYAGTVTPGLSAAPLVSGMTVRFRAHVANAAGATFALNGLAAKPLKRFVAGVPAALVAGEVGLGEVVEATYELTADAWLILSPIAPSASGWVVLARSSATASQGSVSFAVPATHGRFRLEIEAIPAIASAAYLRYSRDDGATYNVGASDYSWRRDGDAAATVETLIRITPGDALNTEWVVGAFEFVPTSRGMGRFETTAIAGDGTHVVCAGGGHTTPGANITNVRFGFVGQSVAQHRMALLGRV